MSPPLVKIDRNSGDNDESDGHDETKTIRVMAIIVRTEEEIQRN